MLTTSSALLQMQGISKRFGATQALDHVSLSAPAGQVTALIGENGAGKSTLMKVLSGAHSADSGAMTLAGESYRPAGPQEARSRGIGIVYQELNLADELSVEDNIMLGMERARWGWLSRRQQRAQVRLALDQLGHPELHPDREVGQLSVGAQQLVEIARSLVQQSRVIVFDEPTSSLPRKDVEQLFRVIERLRDAGCAIIYISHFLEEIRQIADRYVVLRDGRSIQEGALEEATDADIVALMVGRTVDQLFPHVPHSLGPPVLQVDRVSGRPLPLNVSFQLREGEIFGLFGLVGAGRTETLRQIFGLDPVGGGSVAVHGRKIGHRPRVRISAGLGLVSEDRKGEGLAQSLSVLDNVSLSHLRAYSKWGWLSKSVLQRAVQECMDRLQIKADGPGTKIEQLSGGNQQKVALARVLHQDAHVLLLDEPTRGIDVGTKAEIYRMMGEWAASGTAMIFVSSYLPELLAVCDTLGVMSRGRLRAVKATQEWTEQEIVATAVMSS